MAEQVITVRALAKQLAFLQAPHREVMLSGGFGSGKSLAACLRCAMRAVVPGARELLVRKWYSTITRSTLRTLLEGDGSTPAVLPPGTYSHHQTDHVIRLHGGGEILYAGIDQPDKFGSINATGATIDEAAELTDADYRMVRGRVRSLVAGLTPTLGLVTNPGGPSHHLARRFGLDGSSEPQPGCHAISMATSENHHLPADYVADLDRLQGADRERLFLGRWVAAEGLVYPNFDRARMVRTRPGPWVRATVGQDAGYANDPDVMLVGLEDQQGRLHIAEEFYQCGQLTDAVVDEAHRLREKYGVQAFVCDPSAARLRGEMEAKGLPVVPAQNSIADGVRATQRRMTIDGTGEPNFTIDPNCPNLIRELESYQWDPRTDKPRGGADHAVDSLRYLIMHIDAPQSELCVIVIDGRPARPTVDQFGFALDDDDDADPDAWAHPNRGRLWQ
jgi:PBSX family phage terminase large subunit